MHKLFTITLLLAALSILVHACATSEPVTENGDGPELDQPWDDDPIFDFSDEFLNTFFEEIDLDAMDEEELMLYRTRSRLTDGFSQINHDMPEEFLQEIKVEEVDVYQGFRIQIHSTRNVSEADSTVKVFEEWAGSSIAGFSPRGYVHFREPYYRVRVGDFHDRDRAVEFTRMLQVRYPGAWVVHDRVNPYRVPADTVEFRMLDEL